MIAVTFALPQESKDFRSALHHAAVDDRRGMVIGNLGRAEIALGHTGVGFAAATANVRALLAAHAPDYLICTGFAGALDPQLRLGDLVVATNFSAETLLEVCRAVLAGHPRSFFGPLTSQPEASESVAAKSRLAIRTGALAVDMETSAVAEECARAGVPLLAMRVISDVAGSPLPVPMKHWFDLKRQRPRPIALLFYLATHHKQIVPFVRFVSALPKLRAVLARSLIELIEAIAQSRA